MTSSSVVLFTDTVGRSSVSVKKREGSHAARPNWPKRRRSTGRAVVRAVGRDAGVPTTARSPPTTTRALEREVSAGLHAALVEPTRELPHDSRAQQIAHGENLLMHRLIVGDTCDEVATKFIASLG